MLRSNNLPDLDVAITTQQKMLRSILIVRTPPDDGTTIRQVYCYYNLKYTETMRIPKWFKFNGEKIAEEKPAVLPVRPLH